MDTENGSYPTLRDLACEIGQVQIYWSFLENEMRKQLAAGGMQKQIEKGPIISHWRVYMRQFVGRSDVAHCINEVENAAKARNLLAHGIKSVSADPWEPNSAYAICADAEGTSHKLTLDMIRSLSEEIDRVRRAMRGIVALGGVGSG
ncbi:hypothetical protein [Rhizobium sp.]|uniref:hypothetical protein n=1 Tax=Rhizobium sp. TaxID=391 RepID=UPI0011B9479C